MEELVVDNKELKQSLDALTEIQNQQIQRHQSELNEIIIKNQEAIKGL